MPVFHTYVCMVHVVGTLTVLSTLRLLPQTLKPISSLPSWSQPAFDTYRSLNRIQSRLCDTALHTDENLLLCAPTVSPYVMAMWLQHVRT